MLSRAGFPEPQWHKQLQLGRPLGGTQPDCFFPGDDEADKGVCVYLDGLSAHIHGNPATQVRDRQIREHLRAEHYEVIEIAANQLTDRGAMSQHFFRLARVLMSKEEARRIRDSAGWFSPPEQNNQNAVSKGIEYIEIVFDCATEKFSREHFINVMKHLLGPEVESLNISIRHGSTIVKMEGPAPLLVLALEKLQTPSAISLVFGVCGIVVRITVGKGGQTQTVPLPKITAASKIRIVFFFANATDQIKIEWDEEYREIQDKLRATPQFERFLLDPRLAARPEDLIKALTETQPEVVHFGGHGGYSGIALKRSTNVSASVSGEDLSNVFRLFNTRVVVLNACESMLQANAILPHVDCAIGMRSSIRDDAARDFAAAFYFDLGFGGSVQHAFESARHVLRLKKSGQENVPELLVRQGVDAASLLL